MFDTRKSEMFGLEVRHGKLKQFLMLIQFFIRWKITIGENMTWCVINGGRKTNDRKSSSSGYAITTITKKVRDVCRRRQTAVDLLIHLERNAAYFAEGACRATTYVLSELLNLAVDWAGFMDRSVESLSGVQLWMPVENDKKVADVFLKTAKTLRDQREALMRNILAAGNGSIHVDTLKASKHLHYRLYYVGKLVRPIMLVYLGPGFNVLWEMETMACPVE
ncbi:hypothetical protein BC832DRAFT_601323 [Gaertneriomyces semiglobifer]|nr:hypothetical protein BC832DRAFT_601323 [Gaertneriomyces semiglobifer]